MLKWILLFGLCFAVAGCSSLSNSDFFVRVSPDALPSKPPHFPPRGELLKPTSSEEKKPLLLRPEIGIRIPLGQ